MWMEEAPDQRVNRLRAAEALATGAQTIATGCPFCLTMMTDGVAAEGADQVRVRDIAARVGITERATQAILSDLAHEGYLDRIRVGRRNHYKVRRGVRFRHPIVRATTVGEVLDLVLRGERPAAVG
jgi:Fe-S oxidoreductase